MRIALMAMLVGSNTVGAERIYAVHLSPTAPDIKGILTQMKYQGYGAVIFYHGLLDASYFANEHGSEKRNQQAATITALVRYARSLNLEPILDYGNMVMTANSDLLLKKYPGIVYQGKMKDVWNPLFKFPDGRSIYDGLLFDYLDELVGCYGEQPPKYLHIACDECDTAALQMAAQKEHLTSGKFFAREINRVTSYLIKKNITPIIWGDMFLSKNLTKPGVVQGFSGDPRFSDHRLLRIFEMFGDGPRRLGGVDVMDGVNDLTNRDRIIIADWHYRGGTSAGEFPSVDYFQKLGFKDVWASVWYGDEFIRDFAKYAGARNCGGIILCTWGHLAQSTQQVDSLFRALISNSIVYFKNPNVPLPVNPTIFANGPGSSKTCLFPAGSQMTLLATIGDTVKVATEPQFTITVHGDRTYGDRTWKTTIPGRIEKSGNSSVIKASFTIPESDAPGKAYDVKLEYVAENHLLYQGYEEAIFAVSKSR